MRDHASQIVSALLVLSLLGACSGSDSSPTAPETPAPARTLPTRWGTVGVSTGDCGAVDFDLLADSLERGYERARAQVGSVVDTIRLDGLTLSGHRNLECGGTAAYGCYYFHQDLVRFRCGSENVMNHELQHRFCDRLKNPCDCTMTDHAGGFDLSCQPV